MVESRYLQDEVATEALGAELAALTPPGGTWRLLGEMGAGKTSWTRGFVEGLGGDPEEVASPTFAVLHRYPVVGGRVFHLDLFRLGEGGAWSLGLEDELRPEDRLVVEWAGVSGPWPGAWVGELRITMDGEGRKAVWERPVSLS